jgi:hypothetical protein
VLPLTDVAVLIEVRVAPDRQMESIIRVDDIHASRIVGAGRPRDGGGRRAIKIRHHDEDRISSHTASHVGTSRFTKLGILVTIVIVVAGSAAQLINYGFFDQRIPALDPGSDGGAFGAVGDIALAAAAVSAWVLAPRVRSARLAAVALAGLLTFLAVDKVVRLHDDMPHWLAFYLPVLAAAFICLVAVARGNRGEGHPGVDHLIGVGLLLLVFSFLLHVFGKRLLLDLGLSDTAGLAYQTKAVVKHATEVAGWLLTALGLLRLSSPRTRHPDVV